MAPETLGAPQTVRSQLYIEHERVTARRRVDAELHDPPATHVELHSLHEVVSVAEGARDAWLRRQAVTVLRHPAVHRDRRAIHRRTAHRLQVQRPALQAPLWDRVALGANRPAIESAFTVTSAGVVEVLGRPGEHHAAGDQAHDGRGADRPGNHAARQHLPSVPYGGHWRPLGSEIKAKSHVALDVALC